MAFDAVLAERVRDHLDEVGAGARSTKMFGGIAFLVDGNMAVAVIGDDLLVRVGPDGAAAALQRPGTRVFDLTGRPMRGWVVVAGEMLDDDVLAEWTEQGRTFAASLPGK
jgi:TfoX/Sxy family transcriptional regulator of competence genes